MDPNGAAYNPAYLRALAPPPGPTPRFDPVAFRRAKRLGGLNCLYASEAECECSGSHRCHARGIAVANIAHCLECLR